MKHFGKAIALAALALRRPAFAQDKAVEWRFSHWVPPSHPMHPAAEAWAASIEKASGGTIKIKIFPAQQLGKAFDHYNMARDGIADVAHVNPGYEPGRFPVMGAMELPFLFANAKEGSAALDAWYRKYAAKEMADVHYCLTFAHDPGTFHSTKKKIVVPGDVKGMKVRPANATIARFITLLGGTNVQASAPEARDVLEKGVAEAITFPWGSIVLFGIDKVTKYHLDCGVLRHRAGLGDQQGQVRGALRRAEEGDRRSLHAGMGREDRRPMGRLRGRRTRQDQGAPGQELDPLTPAQLAEWRKAAEPLYAEWAENAKKAGYDPDEIMKDLKDSLTKYKSLY